MLCQACERVLDLDTSFPPGTFEGDGLRVVHHESYLALHQAAYGGCDFCQLIVERYQKAGYEVPLILPPDPKLQVSMNFSHDSIAVNIPMLICYDESEEDESNQGYEFGEHNIKLYISTEYSQYPSQ
jgi:hypothetical protein